MPTPIPTPAVFPFEPDAAFEMTERWVFATDVITSIVGRERRVPLVQIPRIILRWTITTTDRLESSRLNGMLWAEFDNRWYGPRWPSARKLSAAPAAGVYTIDTTACGYYNGAKALVWKDSATFDVMTVTAFSGTTVTLSGSTTFGHDATCVVVPLLVGSIQIQLKVVRTSVVSQCDIIFTADVVGVTPAATSGAVNFAGVEVLPEAYSTEDLTENWDIRSMTSGAIASTPFIIRPLAERWTLQSSIGWLTTTRAELESFQKFLQRRRGRLTPVWIPTLTQELVTTADASSGQPVVTVPDSAYDTYYTGDTARKTIAFFVNGALVPATISTWVGNIVTLTANLAVAVPRGTTVVFLKLCRLADDGVEWAMIPGNIGALSTLSFVELPSEVP